MSELQFLTGYVEQVPLSGGHLYHIYEVHNNMSFTALCKRVMGSTYWSPSKTLKTKTLLQILNDKHFEGGFCKLCHKRARARLERETKEVVK